MAVVSKPSLVVRSVEKLTLGSAEGACLASDTESFGTFWRTGVMCSRLAETRMCHVLCRFWNGLDWRMHLLLVPKVPVALEIHPKLWFD